MNNQTAQLLEQHFDTAFAAPGGIKKLRELILSLAMQGKLVAQDPNDPPARELLKEIEAEKRRLVKEGKIKAPKLLPEIKAEEVPYELPAGWAWSKLGDITIFENGDRSKRYPNENDHQLSGIPFFGAKDMVDGVLRFDNGLRFISETKFSELSNGKLINRDFVVLLRGTVGKMAIFRSNDEFSTGFINAQMLILRMLNKELCNFFRMYSATKIFQSLVINKTTGSAVRQMPANVLLDFIVPVPPLPEQHRIVAKIDQLMARCNELEKLRAEREQKRLAIHTATLRQLLTAQEQDSSANAWHFLTRHFSELYSVKENVAQVRKTILQLAVMGKLVPQDPGDPPASQLLKEIEAEKQRLVKEGKIKTPKALPETKPGEMPCALPKGWVWVRFFTVNTVRSELVSAKDFPEENQIAPDSIEKDTGRLLFHRTVSESGATGPNNRFYNGQILYSKIRPSLNKVVIAPYDGLCSADMYPVVCHTNVLFMLRVILSEQFLTQVRLAENRVKMPKLNLESLGQFIIPLPPLPEQHRIVAKIDQLMTLCDTLDQQIAAATGKQTELLDTVMAAI